MAWAQVLDVEVVLVGPEIEDGGVGLGVAEHGLCSGSALVEGIVPMLDPDPMPEAGVEPVSSVSGCEYVGVGGTAVLVDENASFDIKTGGLGEGGVGGDTHAYDYEIAVDGVAFVGENLLGAGLAPDFGDAFAEPEVDAPARVEVGVDCAHLGSEDVGHGLRLDFKDGDLEAGGLADCGDLGANKPGPDYHHLTSVFHGLGDGLGVLYVAKIVDAVEV